MRVLLPALVAAAVLGVAAQPAPALQLSFGSVRLDPLRELPLAQTFAPGPRWRLLQFQQSPNQQQRDALSAQGLRVVQYYPQYTYLAWGDAAAMQRSAHVPGLRWAGDLQPDWKRSPDLHGRSGRIDNVQLLVYDDGRLADQRDAIERAGGRIVSSARAQPDAAVWQMIVSIDASALPGLQQLPAVLWLEYASPRAGLDDEASSQVVAGNYTAEGDPGGVGYLAFLDRLGLTGAGVRFAVTDTGVDYAHAELGPRIVAGYDYPGCTSALGQPGDDRPGGGHGTHVAGILAGAGVVAGAVDAAGYHHGIGVAPAVGLVTLNPICGGGSWPPEAGWQDLSRQALLLGASGSNNSWNSGELGGQGYQASARTHDFMVRDGDFELAGNQEFVMLFSAGNTGPAAGTITAPKEAKNLIVVGSALGTRPTPQIDSIAPSSSRGPAQDGRVLPTVVAPGDMIASTRRVGGASYCAQSIAANGPNVDYAYCSGTSMATPHVAGLAVLLTQDWRESHAGASPSPAMLKALLVNGAVDMNGPPPVPNNSEGWGRAHLTHSLGGGLSRLTLDQSQLLDADGAEFVAQYQVPDADQPIRLTLAWTDAPGAPGANPALVNDLDLIVETPDGAYLGNAFAAGRSVVGGAADALNNLENVYLPAGAAQLISVRVRAAALPGDGVPGSGDDTDQDFALVCSNCSDEPAFNLSIAATPASLCAGQVLERSLSATPLLGFSSPLTLGVAGWPAPGSASYDPAAITTLPGSSTLMLDSTGVATGQYNIIPRASSGALERSVIFPVFVAATLPQAAQIQQPAPGASQVGLLPMLRWSQDAGAFDYQVQIASDERFQDIVASGVTRASQWTPATPLAAATSYYWRVLARNACVSADLFGDRFEDLPQSAGVASASAQFTTTP